MVLVLRGYAIWAASLHQRSGQRKRSAIGSGGSFRLSRPGRGVDLTFAPHPARTRAANVKSKTLIQTVFRRRFPMSAPSSASPESAGMSRAAFDRIDDHLKQRYIGAGRIPGTQLVVFRRGKIVHSAVQGFSDIERKVAMKDDAIFRIYSMTKPITSVAFMMLVEEGRVALDEPVHRYIPEWKNLGVFQAGVWPAFLARPTSRPMLIVDLTRHTSGLTYGFQQRSNVDAAYRELKLGEVEKAGTLSSMVADLEKIPLEFSPGEAWNYSVSTDVIGYLIGLISGKPFETFLQERIFGPLGMKDTGFFVPPD